MNRFQRLTNNLALLATSLLLLAYSSAATDGAAVIQIESPIQIDAAGRIVTSDQTHLAVGGAFLEDSASSAAVKVVLTLPTRSIIPSPLDQVSVPKPISGTLNSSRQSNALVGYTDDGMLAPYHAFRYTPTSGVVDLGTFDTPDIDSESSFATDVDDVGGLVVGYSTTAALTEHAFRWTASEGMADLGAGAGPDLFSRAYGVSGDGNVIVGQSDFTEGSGTIRRAFRYSDDSFEDLGGLGTLSTSLATDVSHDGSVVVGQSTVGNLNEDGRAFRWTADGMQNLGVLPGDSHSVATGVSDDGTIVVGISSPNPLTNNKLGGEFSYYPNTRAFVWTAETGIRDLNDLLEAAGINLAGRRLVAANGLSGDGEWISGELTLPGTEEGDTTVFFASITAILATPCDYNANGVVDAADYTVWRDNLNAATLPNRHPAASGPVGDSDYDFWKVQFTAAGSGSLVVGAPEPSTLLLITVGFGVLFVRVR